MNKIILLSVVFISFSAFAGDLGFRYKEGRCVDSKGQVGLNPSFFGPCGDFRGVTLHRVALDAIDFSGASFESADLQLSSFRKSNLTGVSFKSANLAGLDLTEATLKNAIFTRANLRQIKFGEAEFYQIDFSYSNLSEMQLSYLRAIECNFTGAIFAQSVIDEADFTGSNLNGVDFSKANLQKSNFTSTQAKGAKFVSALLQNTKWTGVNLEGSDLKSARAENSDFTSANLSQTNLNAVNFQGAKLSGVKWTGAKFNRKSEFPFTKEQAISYGMTFKAMDSFVEMGRFAFGKVKVTGTMLDENLRKACQAEGFQVPCNDKLNGPYSDDKCLDVGWTNNGRPMDSLSKVVCNNSSPNACPALSDVFTYMGEKFSPKQSCGVVNGQWCAAGASFQDKFALCVDAL